MVDNHSRKWYITDNASHFTFLLFLIDCNNGCEESSTFLKFPPTQSSCVSKVKNINLLWDILFEFLVFMLQRFPYVMFSTKSPFEGWSKFESTFKIVEWQLHILNKWSWKLRAFSHLLYAVVGKHMSNFDMNLFMVAPSRRKSQQ